jgi:O-acetyl-ADP-ribose deacetylase (regulator of RNase III)
VITYLEGDATCPQVGGPKIIAHVCNDAGGWGKGFVLAISARWTAPEACYRRWYKLRKAEGSELRRATPGAVVSTTGDFQLGEVQLVQVLPDTYVANMIAQAGTRTGSKGPPIRYPAVQASLAKVAAFASSLHASVHMPRIGCGLAGGKWERIEPLIEEALGGHRVLVYDFR